MLSIVTESCPHGYIYFNLFYILVIPAVRMVQIFPDPTI